MLVIGHRGAAAVAPENTLPSFEVAIVAGADAVELDARLTADGAVIVLHDDDLSRTTDGTGFASEKTLADLRSLDAAARHDSWTGGPIRIPLLEEVLELVRGRCGVFVELKATWDARGYQPAVPVARAVMDMLRTVPDVTVSSFDAGAIEAVRTASPELRTALSILRGVPVEPAIQMARAAGHLEIHPAEDMLDEDVVARAHEASLSVCCWTVNDPSRARVLRSWGTDGIFTDDPGMMRTALGRGGPTR